MPQATNVAVHKNIESYASPKRQSKPESNGESFLGELTKSLSETKLISPFEDLIRGSLTGGAESRSKTPIKAKCKAKIDYKEIDTASEAVPTTKPKANKVLPTPMQDVKASKEQGDEDRTDLSKARSLVEIVSPGNDQHRAKMLLSDYSPGAAVDENYVSLASLTSSQIAAEVEAENSLALSSRNFPISNLKEFKTSSVANSLPELPEAEKVQFELLKAPVSFEKAVSSASQNVPLLATKGAAEANEGDLAATWSNASAEAVKTGTGMTSTSLPNQGGLILSQQGQNQQQNQSGQQSDKEEAFVQGISGPANGAKGSGKPQSFGAVNVSQSEKVRAIQELSKQLKSALQKGETHMIVRLRPDDLGAVDIKLNISKDGNVAVLFKAEQRETMELLAKYADAFQQVFQGEGLKADMAGMNFSSSEHQQDTNKSNSPKMTTDKSDIVEQSAAEIKPLSHRRASGIDIQV